MRVGKGPNVSSHSIKANHAKAWDAKPLAYVQRHTLNTVAGLPGGLQFLRS
jgi:hypothetical protein